MTNVWDYIGPAAPPGTLERTIALVEKVWSDNEELSLEEKRALLVTSHGLQGKAAAKMLGIREDQLRESLRRASKKMRTETTGQTIAQALRMGIIS